MTTTEIMQLNCNVAENKIKIQKVLRQIKPLSNCLDEQIPLDKLERCVKVLCDKYGYAFTLNPDVKSSDTQIVWRANVTKQTSNTLSGVNIWGASLYEVMAKTTILIYSKTRRATK